MQYVGFGQRQNYINYINNNQNISRLMDDIINLGGNIELKGLTDTENSKLIVLKKMIGSYVRDIKENQPDYHGIQINFNYLNDELNIEINLLLKDVTIEASEAGHNIFFTLSDCFKKIYKKLE